MSSTSAIQVQVLSAGRHISITRSSDRPSDELWLDVPTLADLTGWHLKPEGLCKGEVCVPLAGAATDSVAGGDVCASRLWKELQRPVLHDSEFGTWMLGEAAEERARQLDTLQAPDFELPDIDGQLHRLSDHRGKKVLLVTWAYW
jgi:hypothetical protein